VVIIGFAAFDSPAKRVYDYDAQSGNVTTINAVNISPYLIEGSDVVLPIRRDTICDVPEIINGNKPADGGHLIIEPEDKDEFLRLNPSAEPYVRRFVSAEEYLNGKDRWVLWLVDAPPNVLRESSGLKQRIEAVRDFRLKSQKESTRRRAERPALFDQIRQPTTPYLLIPRHSSETRRYVPFGYFGPEVIIADSCTAVPDATPFHFGVLSSEMHMAWMRQVCGRLESRYRYSNKLVYNNYPWPQGVTAKQRTAVETAAQAVLDARAQYPTATLADLYDPLTMPAPLLQAHQDLDRAVDRCYRPEPFPSDRHRVEYLFAHYEKLTAPLVAAAKPKRARRAAAR